MNVFVIITLLICFVALAWLWRKTPGLKRTPARTWAGLSRQEGRQALAGRLNKTTVAARTVGGQARRPETPANKK